MYQVLRWIPDISERKMGEKIKEEKRRGEERREGKERDREKGVNSR